MFATVMRPGKHTESINALLNRGGVITVHDFANAMSGSPMPTVYNRIRTLIQKGMLFPSRRGEYIVGYRLRYHPCVNERMSKISEVLSRELTGEPSVISERAGNIIVEVPKRSTDKATQILATEFGKVIPMKVYYSLPEDITGMIVVGSLLSGSPLQDEGGLRVPAIEKILVDLVSTQRHKMIDNSIIQFEFQKAFEVYKPDRSRLLRYADRRGLKDEVNRFVDGVNTDRVRIVSVIQNALMSQPIEKAWLFGSFSRGEENEGSDIDIMVDFSEEENISLIRHASIMNALSDLTEKPIDLVTSEGLMHFATASSNADRYQIYERIH